jgi:putative zinc finger protein
MKLIHNDDPGDDLLVAWHDGEADGLLDAAQAAALEAHIAGCAHCRARLAELDALEVDLRTLALTDRAVDPAFARRVLAALPPRNAVAAPVRPVTAGLAAWWQRQRAALVLVVAGLLIMLLTGDTGLLTGWWQSAGDWWNTAASPDAGGVMALVGTLPGDGTSAEAYLGLVIGALVLAVGAGVFLLHALNTSDSSTGTVPAGRLQLR